MKDLIQEKINNKEDFVVKFSAGWCSPCKSVGKLLTESSYSNIIEVDVDDDFELPQEYGVRGVPTLIRFVNGEKVKTVTGAQTKADLDEFLGDV